MPRNDVIQYVREKDPSAAKASDSEIAAYIKDRYPDLAKELKTSTFSRIEELKAQAPKGEVARKARTHLTNIGMAQAAATQEQENKEAYAKAAGQAAEMLPFAAAAPVTAGLSWPAGLALMGAAGVAGGLMREGTKAAIGSTEIPQTPEALAKTLGVDAVTGMIGEGTGRVAAKFLGAAIPQLIRRSAAKHEIGAKLLQTEYNTARRGLGQASQNMALDVSDSYFKFFNDIETLPKGTGQGALAERLTKLTPETQSVYNDIVKDLDLVNGVAGKSQHVQLDTLIEMKGRINQIAWDKTLRRSSPAEAEALQTLAGNLDKQIRTGLSALPDAKQATALFNQANSVLKVQRRQNVGLILTEEMLKRVGTRAVLGGAAVGLGGGVYGYRKQGFTGALKYGAEGAAFGAGTAMLQAGIPRMSAWALDFMVHHPKTASDVKRAIDFYLAGKDAKASALMMRAASVADVRDALKETLRHPEVIAPTQPPEQMTPPATAER